MIKVGLFITAVEYGGLDKVVLTLLERIDRSRFEIIPYLFVHGNRGTVWFDMMRHLELRYHAVMTDGSRLRYLNPVINARQVIGIARGDGLNLIHAHGPRADFVGIIAAKMLRLACISTCHGYISTDIKQRLYNWFDMLVLRGADRIMAVSEAIRDELVLRGINAGRIVVIQNAASVRDPVPPAAREAARRSFGIGPDDLVLGYAGRISSEKGAGILIEAVGKLSAGGYPVKALILGDGPLKDGLIKRVKEMGIAGRVIFAGFRIDAPEILPAMDIFVLPSLTEGTPMALLEAMSLGVPVIASNVGGVPKVIEADKSGILVPPNRPDAIEEAAIRLWKNKGMMETMAAEARRSIREKYNAGDWIKKIEAEYERLSFT